MKNRRISAISESEESEEEENLRQPSTSKGVAMISENSSSDSSSVSEEPSKPPPPPVDARKRSASTSASPKKNVTLNPLERFVKENKNLTKLDVDDVVSEEDDVCLLEVPKSIDPSEFLERLINFDRKTKIKVNKTRYLIEPEVEDIKPINLLTRKLKIVHPISILRMRQYSKSKRESGAVNEVTSPPALPDKLKVRHPLFGSEFKRKIVLDEEIQRKLDITIDEVKKKMKKKKHKKGETSQEFVEPAEPASFGKKKHKKRATESSEYDQDENRQGNVDESIFALLETHIAEKSKKGHKNRNENARTSSSDSGIFGDVKNKSEHKREYRENEGVDNEYIHKKKRKNNVREEGGNSEYEHKRKHKKSISEGGESHEHQHKKKHVKKAEHQYQENDLNEEDVKDIKRTHINSYKEKRNSHGESSSFYNSLEEKRKSQNSVKQEASDSNDWESNAKLEKKKKYKTSMNEQSQDESFVDSNNFEEKTSKKKKKRRHIKEEVVTEPEQEDEEADESLKRNKRKNRKTDTRMREQEGSQDYVKANTSEKKSRSSFINSTVIPGVQLPLFEFDVSRIVNKEEQGIHDSRKNDEETPEEEKSHKDRRKKEAPLEFNDQIGKKAKKVKKERVDKLDDSEHNDEAISPRKRKKKADSEEEETCSPKKKRKQIKEEYDDDDDVQTNSLILTLLNKVKSEMDTNINQKKKK